MSRIIEIIDSDDEIGKSLSKSNLTVLSFQSEIEMDHINAKVDSCNENEIAVAQTAENSPVSLENPALSPARFIRLSQIPTPPCGSLSVADIAPVSSETTTESFGLVSKSLEISQSQETRGISKLLTYDMEPVSEILRIISANRTGSSKISSEQSVVLPASPEITPSTDGSRTNSDKTKRAGRRKTVHQIINAAAELQFQTISFNELKPKRRYRRKMLSSLSQMEITGKPSIMTNTVQNILCSVSDEFLNMMNTEMKIRSIAQDRIRINFLLKSCDIEPIDFTMGRSFDTLRETLMTHLNRRNLDTLS